MPQVTTSSEAGPGTKIIYCIIIHICLWWNIYMRMDNSLEHFISVAGGTFFTQTIPPASSLIFKWYRCSSSLPLIAGEPGPDWVIRALIGRAGPWLGNTGPVWAIRRGGTGVCDSDSFYKLGCTYIYTLNMTIWDMSNVKTEGETFRYCFENETKTFWNRSRICLVENRLFWLGPESALRD